MPRLILDSWLDVDFRAARDRNFDLARAGELDAAIRCCERSPPKAMRALSSWIGAHLPYQFDGDAHHILDFESCLARGYGACADAAALAGVCLLEAGHVGVRLCYETLRGEPDYAHVRVHFAEALVEPWPSVRRPVNECQRLIDFRSLQELPR